MLLLMLACALGDGGPATPGSPSATLLADVDRIATSAAGIEARAIELEEAATAARGLSDPASRAAAVADVSARMEAIRQDNAALQVQVHALEAALRAAGVAPATP